MTKAKKDTIPALECNGVTKEFDRLVVGGGYTTFKTQLIHWLRREPVGDKLSRERRVILKGLTFKVMPGETVAVIGQNGAGKSTLLKLVTGIYKPTSGTLKRNGRISALLELGAGFHPEFSGRENIYVNGLILGLSRKELQALEQQIIDFSELGDFIDAPVRTYSSGMYMRLAFSIAVNVDPDILIIDEILSVGDEHFQHKSRAKLDEFKRKNVAILLVTHDLKTAETWSNRALWLDKGLIAADGDPRVVCQRYRDSVRKLEAAQSEAPAGAPVERPAGDERSDGIGRLLGFRVKDASGKEIKHFDAGAPMTIEVDYEVLRPMNENARVGLRLTGADGLFLFATSSYVEGTPMPPGRRGTARCVMRSVPTVGRQVQLDLFLASGNVDHDVWLDATKLDFVDDRYRPGVLKIETDWSYATDAKHIDDTLTAPIGHH